MKKEIIVAFLLGIALTLGVALFALVNFTPRPVFASEAGKSELFGMLGQGYLGQSRDTLFVIDPKSKRLLVYDYNKGTLNLSAVRNIEGDLRFQEYSANGQQNPSVSEIRRKLRKGK